MSSIIHIRDVHCNLHRSGFFSVCIDKLHCNKIYSTKRLISICSNQKKIFERGGIIHLHCVFQKSTLLPNKQGNAILRLYFKQSPEGILRKHSKGEGGIRESGKKT